MGVRRLDALGRLLVTFREQPRPGLTRATPPPAAPHPARARDLQEQQCPGQTALRELRGLIAHAGVGRLGLLALHPVSTASLYYSTRALKCSRIDRLLPPYDRIFIGALAARDPEELDPFLSTKTPSLTGCRRRCGLFLSPARRLVCESAAGEQLRPALRGVRRQ